MKTALAYFFSLLVILFFSSLFLVSCKSKQPLETKTETKEVNYDSINKLQIITVNKEIIDSLKIVIGRIYTDKKECDSVCQIAVDRLLSQLNTKKTSGDNSFGAFYDKKDKSLNFNARVGATKNDSISFTKIIYRTKTVYSHKDIPVNRSIPKWQLILMIIGSGTIGFFILKLILFFRTKIPV